MSQMQKRHWKQRTT